MKWLMGIVILVTVAALAESELVRPEIQNVSQSGKLVTLNVIPNAKAIEFSIVGKPALKLDLANASLDVLILERGKTRPMNMTKLAEGRYISGPVTSAEPLRMKVRVKVGGESEKFEVSIPPR